jgi:hypothetical protein
VTSDRELMHLIDPVFTGATLCGLEADTVNRRSGAMCQFLGRALVQCVTCRAKLRDLVAVSLDVPVASIGGEVSRTLLKSCARKLGYLVRDYPGDKESRELIERLLELSGGDS